MLAKASALAREALKFLAKNERAMQEEERQIRYDLAIREEQEAVSKRWNNESLWSLRPKRTKNKVKRKQEAEHEAAVTAALGGASPQERRYHSACVVGELYRLLEI